MDRPTATDLRKALPAAVWENLGYPAIDPPPPNPDDDPLNFIAQIGVDYVEQVTGRPQNETMPQQFERIALLADALATASMGTDMSSDQLEAIAGAGVLQSFSADGYSETYRSGGGGVKEQRDARMVHPWPLLDRLLWMLMTPEQRAWWFGFLSDGGVPSWGVVEMDWSGNNRLGGLPGAPGDPGLPGDDMRIPAGGPFGSLPPTTPGWDGPLD